MSLVNEALKKARLEAARQDAARRGVPLPGASPTRQPLAPSAVVRGVAFAALVLVAVLIFLAGRRFGGEPATPPIDTTERATASGTSEPKVPAESPPSPMATASAPAPEATASAPAPSPPATSPPRATEPTPAPQPNPAAPPSPAAVTDVARPEAEPEVRAEPEPRRTPARRQRRRAAGSGARATAEPATEAPSEPRSVVRRLELASGALELGGIAWSEERPFALINGRVVGPGDQVENLMVVSVQPRHVELRGEEGHYLLLLK